jgi:hypothetical protein
METYCVLERMTFLKQSTLYIYNMANQSNTERTFLVLDKVILDLLKNVQKKIQLLNFNIL